MLKNYKIKVNTEAESKDAQELFFELGYKIECFVASRFPRWLATTDQGEEYWYSTGCGIEASLNGFQELTPPQLRDLVVLHRNDIHDANWVTEGDDQIYQDSNGKSFIFREQGWDELQRHEMRQAMWEKIKPKPQHAETEQGLISGADALRALADGEEVELRDKENNWVRANNHHLLGLFLGNAFDFRRKPRTITLNGDYSKSDLLNIISEKFKE